MIRQNCGDLINLKINQTALILASRNVAVMSAASFPWSLQLLHWNLVFFVFCSSRRRRMTSSQCSRRYEYRLKTTVCLWENELTGGQILILTILTFGKASWPNDPDFRECALFAFTCGRSPTFIKASKWLPPSNPPPPPWIQLLLLQQWGWESWQKKICKHNPRHCPSFVASWQAYVSGSDNSSLTLSVSAFIQIEWLQNLMSFNQMCPTSALWGLHGWGAESATLTSRRGGSRQKDEEWQWTEGWILEGVSFMRLWRCQEGLLSAPFFISSLISLQNTIYSHAWGQEFVHIQDDAFGFVVLSQVVGECLCTSNCFHQISQR